MEENAQVNSHHCGGWKIKDERTFVCKSGCERTTPSDLMHPSRRTYEL